MYIIYICLLSVTGVPASPNGTLRRSASTLSQGQKPPPPVRRNSSIQSNLQQKATIEKGPTLQEPTAKSPPTEKPPIQPKDQGGAQQKIKVPNNLDVGQRKRSESNSSEGPPPISPKPSIVNIVGSRASASIRW